MSCPFCGRDNYVTSNGVCLNCGRRVFEYKRPPDLDHLVFWSNKVDYVFYSPFFEEFFKERGYKEEYKEELREYFRELFSKKIVGKGEYNGEPFLYFEQNFSMNPWKKSFQLMFFKRDKKRRYLTFCSESLSGGFLISPMENDSKGTVLVEGPLDCVSLGFIFRKYQIPLSVFSGFGYHRTIEISSRYWPILSPLFSFFDKDLINEVNNLLSPGFEFLYLEFGNFEDPDDLLRVDLDIEKIINKIKESVYG